MLCSILSITQRRTNQPWNYLDSVSLVNSADSSSSSNNKVGFQYDYDTIRFSTSVAVLHCSMYMRFSNGLTRCL
jgi:hypothetical protein